MVEEEDIYIQYIRSEENTAYIKTTKILKANLAKHMRRITEGGFWELMDTERDIVKKTGVTDDVITRDKIEYSSH